MYTVLESDFKEVIGSMAQWTELCSQIRDFRPDYVVLVARKMPRLFDAIRLDVGSSAICISDQAVPFVRSELTNARVAIVDDLWNVGSTMLHVKSRVDFFSPRAVKLFALGAKDAASTVAHDVSLAERTSLGDARYEQFVSLVPDILRSIPKPYDADFPIVRYVLRTPFTTWDQCWAWLQLKFGTAVHASVDDALIERSQARASVSLRNEHGWVVKLRLFFDFAAGFCNVVPMALAPSLPLRDVYPEGSLAKAVFDAVSSMLGNLDKLSNDEKRDPLGRLGAFCDSLLFASDAELVLSDLLSRDSTQPFSIKDFAMQFGPSAAKKVEECFRQAEKSLSADCKGSFLANRAKPSKQPLLSKSYVVSDASNFARDGLPAQVVFGALFKGLAKCAGADKPSEYCLDVPFPSRDEILVNPYLRLRIGFTYAELLEFIRAHVRFMWVGSTPESMTSVLMDTFIDLGAIVPTIMFSGDLCVRVYRKGEADPRWDTDVVRLALALKNLKGQKISRTRVSKVAAIMASSSLSKSSGLRIAAAERGTVAVMGKSVLDRSDLEVTNYFMRTGLWKKFAGETDR